jgi:hypothetical protein
MIVTINMNRLKPIGLGNKMLPMILIILKKNKPMRFQKIQRIGQPPSCSLPPTVTDRQILRGMLDVSNNRLLTVTAAFSDARGFQT